MEPAMADSASDWRMHWKIKQTSKPTKFLNYDLKNL